MNRSKNIFLLLLCAQLAQAQGSDPLRRAERYRAAGDHYNAALQYEQYLGLRKGRTTGYAPYAPVKTGSLGKAAAASKTEVYAKLANCYYELHDYAKAAEFYAQAGTLAAADGVRYVQSLRASGRAADAQARLQELQTGTLTPETQALAAIEATALRFTPGTDAYTTVAKADGDVNTGHGNYAAVRSGTVTFFTSSRADSAAKTKGPNRNHVYRIVGTDAILADPLPAAAADQGLCSFSPDGRRMFFTVWNQGGGKNARIYTVTREDGGWTAPVPVEGAVNLEGSNNAQPCYVENRGSRMLFFASDRPGGKGGYDIWMASLDEQYRTKEVSNVTAVNTIGDEQAPFFHLPTGKLVFASKGHPGMGGYDLFVTNMNNGAAAAVEHLGAPINSVKDDSYFFTAAKDTNLFREALLSSDRASDCCLEVFTITRKDPPPPPPVEPKKDTVVTPPVTPPFVMPVVRFEFDKATLRDEDKAALDAVAEYLQQHTEVRLRIGGYTDTKGGERYNDRLSDRRARAVRDYLAAKGIENGRLWIKGFGECCPLAPEQNNGKDDPDARAQNRRVELKEEREP